MSDQQAHVSELRPFLAFRTDLNAVTSYSGRQRESPAERLRQNARKFSTVDAVVLSPQLRLRVLGGLFRVSGLDRGLVADVPYAGSTRETHEDTTSSPAYKVRAVILHPGALRDFRER